MSKGITRLTGMQIRAARALLRITSAELAAMAKVGPATVRRAEQIDGETKMNNVVEAAVRRALEDAGIAFVEGEIGTGVALKPGAKIPERSGGILKFLSSLVSA